MTALASGGKARTMSFHVNDVRFVPAVAGHFIENTGTEDVGFLEMFKSAEFSDVSLNQWIRRLRRLTVEEHLHLNSNEIARFFKASFPGNHISCCLAKKQLVPLLKQ